MKMKSIVSKSFLTGMGLMCFFVLFNSFLLKAANDFSADFHGSSAGTGIKAKACHCHDHCSCDLSSFSIEEDDKEEDGRSERTKKNNSFATLAEVSVFYSQSHVNYSTLAHKYQSYKALRSIFIQHCAFLI
jgi:hypothetical protein